jgi:integrase
LSTRTRRCDAGASGKAAAAAGYPELQPRDLRHTCASMLAAVNTPRVEIEAQMGHRADTSERIYQHLIDELRGAADY